MSVSLMHFSILLRKFTKKRGIFCISSAKTKQRIHGDLKNNEIRAGFLCQLREQRAIDCEL